MENYEQKLSIGDYVKGKRTFNGEVIEGKFNGFHLYDKLNPNSVVGIIETDDRCYDVCPDSIELVESEDERIRKEIISYIKSSAAVTNKEWITWLEKHGEQNPAMIQWKGNNLKEVIDFTGLYKDGFEKWFHNSWEEFEKYVHEHNNIFKIFNKDGSHIEVPVGAWIVKTPDGYNTASRYVFRQKPAWSEEDEKLYTSALWHIKNSCGNGGKDSGEYEVYNWLKSLKDRVHPKQEWSEEDEKMCQETIDWFEKKCFPYALENENPARESINWLKSLKPRWRPSEYDISLLEEIVRNIRHNVRPFCSEVSSLEDLIKNLKTL